MSLASPPALTPFHRHREHLPPPIDPALDRLQDDLNPEDFFTRGFTRSLTSQEQDHYLKRCQSSPPDWSALEQKTHRWIRQVIVNPPLAEFCLALPVFQQWFPLAPTNVLFSAWPYLPEPFQQRVLDSHPRYYVTKLFTIHNHELPLDFTDLGAKDFGCLAIRKMPADIQQRWWTKRLARQTDISIGELMAYMHFPITHSQDLPLTITRWIHPSDQMAIKPGLRKLLNVSTGLDYLNKRTGGFYLFPDFDLRTQALTWASPEKQLRLWHLFATLPPDQCLSLVPPSLDDVHGAIIKSRLAGEQGDTHLETLTRWISSVHRTGPSGPGA